MAKKLASEMTKEELAARHLKSAQRRAERKESNKDAIEELCKHLDCEIKELSEGTRRFIQLMLGDFVRQQVAVKEGDTLQSLFMAHANLSYKKLQKKCEAAGLKISEKGIIVKA